MFGRILWILMALALVAGCRTVPVAGECPESAGIQCLTAKICQPDERRGCQKCTCEGAWNSDPDNERKRVEGGR